MSDGRDSRRYGHHDLTSRTLYPSIPVVRLPIVNHAVLEVPISACVSRCQNRRMGMARTDKKRTSIGVSAIRVIPEERDGLVKKSIAVQYG